MLKFQAAMQKKIKSLQSAMIMEKNQKTYIDTQDYFEMKKAYMELKKQKKQATGTSTGYGTRNGTRKSTGIGKISGRDIATGTGTSFGQVTSG